MRAGAKRRQRNRAVIQRDVDILERQHAQRNRIRRAEVGQRLAVFGFRLRLCGRHLFGVHHHIDVFNPQRIDAQRTVFQAGEIDREMKLSGFHIHTRHFVVHAFERQITPSAFGTGDIQPRYKTVSAVDHQMQAGLRTDQEGHQAD